MGLTPLVKDAHGLVVNHGHAGISRASSFVQQQAVRFGPGNPEVQGGLDHHSLPTAETVRVGEQEPALPLMPQFAIHVDQASHARPRFNERLLRGGVLGPSLPTRADFRL